MLITIKGLLELGIDLICDNYCTKQIYCHEVVIFLLETLGHRHRAQ